jgi:hypothetical protein
MPRKICLAALLLLSLAPASARGEHRISNDPIAACSGIHTDSGGSAGNYGFNETFLQTLWPSKPGTRLRLTFLSFESEENFDELYLFNGHNSSAPFITVWSGAFVDRTITSTAVDGSLTLSWQTDDSFVRGGWLATISCVPAEQRMREGTASLCSARFTDSAGPAGPYANAETSVLTVRPDQPGAQLQLDVSAFSTQFVDRLYVYDGTSTSAPLIDSYFGTIGPFVVRATNSEGALTFRFSSDGSGVDAGWDAWLSCVLPIVSPPSRVTCDGTFTDSGGVAGDYGISESYEQVLHPSEPGAKLELSFLGLDTEAGADVLTIYDGSGSDISLIGAYSGTTSPGTVTANEAGGELTVSWVSNSSVTRPGWLAFVRCVHPIRNTVVTTCGTLSTDTGGRGWPYLDNEIYLQTFTPAIPRSRVRVTFHSFSSEFDFDKLRVRDGGAGAPQIAVLQGTPPMPVSYQGREPAGRLSLDWLSDSSNVLPGWAATVACDPPLVVDGFEGGSFVEWAGATP